MLGNKFYVTILNRNNRSDGMKEERKLLAITAMSNILIGIIKLIGGVLFHVNALMVDSIYTFSDSVTDVIALIGSKVAQKRPNRRHPYGFGRAEYIANLFISIILFLVGGYLFLHSFAIHQSQPSMLVFLFIGIALIIKLIMIKFAEKKNKKIKSPIIEDDIEEARLDILSSIFVGVVILLLTVSDRLPVLRYADMVASIVISMLIFKTAYPILKNSLFDLIGEVEIDDELTLKIKDISQELHVPVANVELMKYGRYYGVRIEIVIDEHYTLRQAKRMQQKLILQLRKYKRGIIKDVDVDFKIQ